MIISRLAGSSGAARLHRLSPRETSMRSLCLLAILVVSASFTSYAASAADRAIIILDASGSMWGQIDGRPKLEIARETLKKVLPTIPADLELGLMAYGHREKGNCNDIELVVPPAAGTAEEIGKVADRMQFLGKTPLSESVRRAAEDLGYAESKSTVILITDGIETCEADPCAVARALEESGVDLTVHVVGFGLTEDEGRKVACLANETGGKYIQASDAEGLEDALKTTVGGPKVSAALPNPLPPPAPKIPEIPINYIPHTVLADGGPAPPIDVFYEVYKTDGSGAKGDRVDAGDNIQKFRLNPGDYVMTAQAGFATAEQPVTLTEGKVEEPVFNLNAGGLILRARPAPGAEIDENAQIIITYPGGESATNYGQVKTVVPEGEQKVTVLLGAGVFEETIQLKPGQIVEKDLVVGVGKAIANAVYMKNGDKVVSDSLNWTIYRGAEQADGVRDIVSSGYGAGAEFDLPAGSYVAGVEMQAAKLEVPFTVEVDKTTQIDADLNAGVVKVDAPGAEEMRIYEAKVNLQGERQYVFYHYGETFDAAIVAGDYVVVATFKTGKSDSETPFNIRAGERTEVTVQ